MNHGFKRVSAMRNFSAFVLLCLLALPARSGTDTVVAFLDRIFDLPNPIQEVDVTFPDDNRVFEKIEVELTLEPPDGLDGDEWDRMGHIYMYDQNGNWIEIARLITPFWNPPWTWRLDITELQLLLRGDKRVGVWLQSWKDDGYQVSVNFIFTEGPAPNMVPVRIDNLWNGAAWGYGNVGNTRMERFLSPITVPINAQTDQVLSRVSVTGHRFVDNTESAAEFLRRSRTLVVNGGGNWTNELWQECGSWPVQPQNPGTWWFDRSGWCPGDLVDPWIVDVTSQTTPGQDAVVEYIPDEYVNNGPAQDAMEQFGSQLIQLQETIGFIAAPITGIAKREIEGTNFSGSQKTYTLFNFGASAFTVTASASSPWFSVMPASQSIPAGESRSVTVTVEAAAEALSPGMYSGTVTLTNTSQGESQTRDVSLNVIEKQLTAHWRFDEASGSQAVDASGNNYNGQLQGTDFGAASVPGVYGTAVQFDGSDDFVNAGNVPIEGFFSFAAWVKPADQAAFRCFASKFGGPANTFWFGQRDNHVMRLGVFPSVFERAMNGTTPLEIDEWTHVVATYDGKFMRLYLDGVLHGTSADHRYPLRLKVGDLLLAQRNNGLFYNGAMDDARLYNYAVTEAEIARMMCPADLNGDGIISALDLPIAIGSWPQPENLPDMNTDNRFDIRDLILLMETSGNCP